MGLAGQTNSDLPPSCATYMRVYIKFCTQKIFFLHVVLTVQGFTEKRGRSAYFID